MVKRFVQSMARWRSTQLRRRAKTALVPLKRQEAHESGVRRMMADAQGELYLAAHSLDEARSHEGFIVVMEGDYGGQIYVVCPVRLVACSEAALKMLLTDLDQMVWDDPNGTALCFEARPRAEVVSGGMGGGLVREGVWLHRDLVKVGVEEDVRSVLAGLRERLRPSA